MGKFPEISWPADYSELKRMEELLVCGICYDYMETSVMTPCSHNYCSLCIRKYLHYKTQCPACFEKTFEKDLHTNRILDEIILYFQKIRQKLVDCIVGAKLLTNNDQDEMDIIIKSPKTPPIRPARTNQLQKTPIKTDIIIDNNSCHSELVTNTNIDNEKPQTSNFINNNNNNNNMSSPSTSGIPKIAKLFTPKSRKILDKQTVIKQVACPVCSVEISEFHINKHLDACLKRETMIDKPRCINNKRRPLPKLVTKLMKDSELKKKMKEYNLPINGDRKTLENRFHKYITLYNSECDKEKPRNPLELVKQLDDEENLEKKNQQKNINIGKLKVTRNAEQNIIEMAQKNYLEANKKSFQNLIESMKKRDANLKNKKTINHDNNNDDDDNNKIIKTSSPIKNLNQSNNDDSSFDNSMSIFESGFQDTSDDSSCPLQRYTSTHPNNFLSVEINENAMSPQKLNSTNTNKNIKQNNNTVLKINNENNNSCIFDQSTDIDSSDNEDEVVNCSPPSKKIQDKKIKLIEKKNNSQDDAVVNLNNQSTKVANNIKEIQAKNLAKSIVKDFVVDSSDDDDDILKIPNDSNNLKEINNITEENNDKTIESITASRPIRKRNFPSRFSNFETIENNKLAQPTRIESIELLNNEIDENQVTVVNENNDNTLKRRRRRKCVNSIEENKNPPRRPIRKRDLSTVLQDAQK